VSVCHALPAAATRGCDPALTDGGAIQVTPEGECVRVGARSGAAAAAWVGGFDGAGVGLALTFTGGAASPGCAASTSDGHRTTTLVIVCADTAGEPAVREPRPCVYEVKVRDPAGCPAQCPRDATGAVCGGSARGECAVGADGAGAHCICGAGFVGATCSNARPGVAGAAAPPPPPAPAGNPDAQRPQDAGYVTWWAPIGWIFLGAFCARLLQRDAPCRRLLLLPAFAAAAALAFFAAAPAHLPIVMRLRACAPPGPPPLPPACVPPSPSTCTSECKKMVEVIRTERYKSSWVSYYSDVARELRRRGLSEGVIVEVGTAYGGLAAALLAELPELKVIAVDPFLGGYDSNDAMSQFYDSFRAEHGDFSALWANALAFDTGTRFCGRYTLHHATSDAGAKLVAPHSVDAVFIDGDHTRVGIERDIATWADVVRKGGIMLFNDYSSSFPGVVEAVNAFAARTQQPVWAVPPKERNNVGLCNLDEAA